jgi:putative Flp pilus-assembly TadE/G-like protein
MDLRRWLWNEKGNVLIFTTALVVPLMIIFGGLALDLAHLGTVDDEIQRSLDAAALAGAGKLGFDSSVFPAARAWAQNYALLNPLHNGGTTLATINLNLNTPNTANGDIVLGIWNGSSFTPSLDGTQVNAVLCRYQTTVPMTFLGLLGFTSLPAAGEAIAWATQPVTPPQDECVFPMALSSCFFGGSTSAGCGATVTFISSASGSAVGGNTAAWGSIVPGQAANDANILAQVKAAAGGACTGAPLSTGDNEPVSNGQLNNVVNWLGGNDPNAFPAKYAASSELVVAKADGTDAYRGKGWAVYVPVIDTGAGCPPAAINGSPPIVGWTRMVITQILGKNGTCAVANHWAGNPWDEHCFTDKNGTASSLPSGWAGQTGIFGYYDCKYSPAPPSPVVGPITATARLRLVR